MIHAVTTISMLLLLGAKDSATPSCDVSANEVTAAEATLQQGPKLGAGMYPSPSGSPPRGGTPEPSLLLLMSGGALAYGALRRTRKRQVKTPEA